MSVAKILLLGTWLVSFGTIAYLYLRMFRKIPPNSMIHVVLIPRRTVQNVFWWVGVIACFVVAFLIVRSWSGNPVFWILLGITELIPVGLLTLFLVMVSRLREANDAIKSIR